MDKGIWCISHVNLEYNHELAKHEETQFLRSGRHVSNTFERIMHSTVDAGIGPKKLYFLKVIDLAFGL